MSQVLKGKPVVEEMKRQMKQQVEVYQTKGICPKMAIVRVGRREDDIAYERSIIKKCDSVGIQAEVYETDASITMEEFTDLLKQVNADDRIHGILVFRPLPQQLNIDVIKNMVDPMKDIDCMNPINLQKIFEGDSTGFSPCTPEAVIEILKFYNIPIKGAKAVIVNRSMVLGKPLAMMLLKENATVKVCHSKTKNLEDEVSQGDIVVTGAGKAKYFGKSYFNSDAAIIDVGINYLDGKMCGDVNYDQAAEGVFAITPVPGGVGTVTSTILLRHVLEAVSYQINE